MKIFVPVVTPKWQDPPIDALPEELESLQLPELILRLLQRQGMQTASQARAFMDLRHYVPASPYDLTDMQTGIERTLKAIKDGELIGVWGDFDVDGQTSTALLVSALRKAGARVIYHIPVRGPESHGIKLEVLQRFVKPGVSLLITCDTGISEVESVAWAQSHGVDVIITDHHTLPEELPKALAVINSQRVPPTHPLRPLPGVGVACKFAEALLEQIGQTEFAISLHDLAALGIVADVADLRADARYLAQSGIDLIRRSARPSLQALLQAAELEAAQFSEESISFALAPRMNAVGRLNDANPMVDFLLSHDPSEIAVTVNRLEGLNGRRKLYCDQIFQGALDQIKREPGLLDHPVLMLHHPEWRAGVVGIVASRLVDLFHRPVILFVSPPDELMRGSARSIEGVNITAAIRNQADLLTSFGGHPMAAGLALPQENFTRFQRGLDKIVETGIAEHPIERILQIDAWQQPDSIDLNLLEQLETLAPFGAGNPPPVFAGRNLRMVSATPVGKLKEHLQVIVENEQGVNSKFIWWQGAGMPRPEGSFDLAFNAHTSNYKGQPQVSLEWLDFRTVEQDSLSLSTIKSTKMEHVEYRGSKDRLLLLRELISKVEPEVYREGVDIPSTPGKLRFELENNAALVIWSIPPSQKVLAEIIENVKPQKVYWFGDTLPEDELENILKNVAQQIKQGFADNQTLFDPKRMAAALGTTDAIVRLAFKWLAARGNISINYLYQETAAVESGGVLDAQMEKDLQSRLKKEFAETQAFRRYYQRSTPESLIAQN